MSNKTKNNRATIIGAGLAGSEEKSTKAHKTSDCAELVCSNSFRGVALSNAVGLLKLELKEWNSIIMQAAHACEVPAGGCLAVDRLAFSKYVDSKIRNHKNINFIEKELTEIPDCSPLIIASGPLTSRDLADSIIKLTGETELAFFDAISPIIFNDSLNHNICFRQSRYDKGGADYLNIPLNKEQYYTFIEEVRKAEKYTGNEDVEKDRLDELKPFEGCMPIEDMVERGEDVARFGPLKPVGLTDPNSDIKPHAVMQLRQDDKDGKTWSLVGMQTRMKRHEQDRIFKSLPGLEKAEFVRYGSVHRNTFINSPKLLNPTLEFRKKPGLFFAGQITGTEGYVESTAGGMLAGINVVRLLKEQDLLTLPTSTAMGSLFNYISEPTRDDFQPMNISFGIIPDYLSLGKDKEGKKAKREKFSKRALETSKENFLRIASL